MKCISRLSLVMTLGVLTVSITNAADYIYWSTIGHEPDGPQVSKIKRALLDGTSVETILSGPPWQSGRFGGIAFDTANGQFYSGDDSFLFRANLDGSGRVNLVPSVVTDVELDLVHGRIYWSDFSSLVYSAKLDGTDVQALVSTPNTEGLAIDPVGGKFYFRTGNSEISVANLDGSGQSVFIALDGGSDLFDMEIDPVNRKIYWNDYYQHDISLQHINRANLDGPTSVELVLKPPTGAGDGMHWDEAAHKLYYAGNTPPNAGPIEILRVNGDGTQLESVVSEPAWVNYIAVIHGIPINDTEPPLITCPVNLSVPCSQDRLVTGTYPPAIVSDNSDPAPTVTYSIPSGSGFPVGTTTVTVTATDASGNHSSCSFTVTRAPLSFTGFLSPVGGADASGGSFADPLRTFKLKSTIPLKFAASCGGSPIVAGIHTLQAVKWSSQTDSDPPIDATPTDAATTGNQFRLTGSEWHFNLDTKATGMSAGKWQIAATLSDGSQHSAWVQIK